MRAFVWLIELPATAVIQRIKASKGVDHSVGTALPIGSV